MSGSLTFPTDGGVNTGGLSGPRLVKVPGLGRGLGEPPKDEFL